MKIVVIGGTGLIGSKVVANLAGRGHSVLAASPASGVDTVSGEGLADAFDGADVVVDLANSPSFEDEAVLQFFQTSGRNVLRAEGNAGVAHHVALSVVGADRLPRSGYLRAKVAQEMLIKASPIPYTIVRSTQFFEFLPGIARSAAEGQAVRLPAAYLQPIASDDVAAFVTDAVLAAPAGRTPEIAGPDRFRMSDLMQRFFDATGDARTVVADPRALYFGAELSDGSLLPGEGALIGAARAEDWLEKLARPR